MSSESERQREDYSGTRAANTARRRAVCRLLGHRWVDIRNSVVESGEWCSRCNAIRAGNEATGG